MPDTPGTGQGSCHAEGIHPSRCIHTDFSLISAPLFHPHLNEKQLSEDSRAACRGAAASPSVLCPQLMSEQHLPFWALAARFTGQPSVTRPMPSWAAGVWKPLYCPVKAEVAQPNGLLERVCLKQPPAALCTSREKNSFCKNGSESRNLLKSTTLRGV